MYISVCCLCASEPLVDASSADIEQQLRELRPTAANRLKLRNMMARTRQQRRRWMAAERPDTSSVLERWPRLFDVNEVVCTL